MPFVKKLNKSPKCFVFPMFFIPTGKTRRRTDVTFFQSGKKTSVVDNPKFALHLDWIHR
jgi:hypothetical protein